MAFYRVTTTKLNIRDKAEGLDIGDLFLNDVIEVAESMGGWQRIVKIARAGDDFFVDPPNKLSSWCSAAYTVLIADPQPEPEPTPEPTVKPLTVMITGEDYESVTITLNPKPTTE